MGEKAPGFLQGIAAKFSRKDKAPKPATPAEDEGEFFGEGVESGEDVDAPRTGEKVVGMPALDPERHGESGIGTSAKGPMEKKLGGSMPAIQVDVSGGSQPETPVADPEAQKTEMMGVMGVVEAQPPAETPNLASQKLEGRVNLGITDEMREAGRKQVEASRKAAEAKAAEQPAEELKRKTG